MSHPCFEPRARGRLIEMGTARHEPGRAHPRQRGSGPCPTDPHPTRPMRGEQACAVSPAVGGHARNNRLRVGALCRRPTVRRPCWWHHTGARRPRRNRPTASANPAPPRHCRSVRRARERYESSTGERGTVWRPLSATVATALFSQLSTPSGVARVSCLAPAARRRHTAPFEAGSSTHRPTRPGLRRRARCIPVPMVVRHRPGHDGSMTVLAAYDPQTLDSAPSTSPRPPRGWRTYRWSSHRSART